MGYNNQKKTQVAEDTDVKYRVVAKSREDDSTFKSGLITSKEDADTRAAKMRKAKRRDGAPQYDSVKVVKESCQLKENVLDSVDDDGFMAKRQLYDIAKYAVELHRMIQDTDNLEPWIQAKITKAADYIDTVKHYMEYQGVRDAEDTADVIGPPDLGDIDGIGGELDRMVPEEEIMEYDNELGFTGDDLIDRAMVRGILPMMDIEKIDPRMADIAYDVAQYYFADAEEIGSSDISIALRDFVRQCNDAGIMCDGPKAHLYESEIRARKIYNRMTRVLRGRK